MDLASFFVSRVLIPIVYIVFFWLAASGPSQQGVEATPRPRNEARAAWVLPSLVSFRRAPQGCRDARRPSSWLPRLLGSA
jgi:hypothetical protein